MSHGRIISRSDTHPDLHLEIGDTVVFSSKQIPGNERPIARMRNQFAVAGVKSLMVSPTAFTSVGTLA